MKRIELCDHDPLNYAQLRNAQRLARYDNAKRIHAEADRGRYLQRFHEGIERRRKLLKLEQLLHFIRKNAAQAA